MNVRTPALFLLLRLVPIQSAFAQDAASSRQVRGIDAMNAARARALRTGEPDDNALRVAVEFLVGSERELIAAGRGADAALSAIHAGSSYKLMGEVENSVAAYQRSLALAKPRATRSTRPKRCGVWR